MLHTVSSSVWMWLNECYPVLSSDVEIIIQAFQGNDVLSFGKNSRNRWKVYRGDAKKIKTYHLGE